MKEIIIALLIWNIVTFLLMGIDKYKAVKGKRRISEATLIGVSFALGATGSIVGALVFRHKTKKAKFIILLQISMIINIAAFVGIYTMFIK